MDFNLIKKLIKVVESSEISEFSIQEGDLKLKISKNSGKFQVASPVIEATPSNAIQPNVQSSVNDAKPIETESNSVKSNLHEIKSPIVGTFYSAPAPDADPYIKVGDNITSGSVLCIVEAMKLMNEIEADVDGKVVEILVNNGTPVEYNQPLFLVEKK